MKTQGKRIRNGRREKRTVIDLIYRYYDSLEKGDRALPAILRNERESEEQFDQEKVYQRLLLQTGRRERTIRMIRKSVRIAASVALVCAFLLVYQYRNNLSHYLNLSSTAERTTAYGEIAEVTLSDGTRLWLNSGSTVSYPKTFEGATREIDLVGEAYLDVASDPEKPFLIHTEGVVVKVLGTRFNISAYRNDKNITVAVLEGKVGVSANDAGDGQHAKVLYVTRNQQAIYARDSRTLSREEKVNTETATSWKEGTLIYHGTPLPEILADLQRKYDVSIHAAKQVENCIISANFNNESLEKVLTILAELVNGEISKNGNRYYIRGRGCRTN